MNKNISATQKAILASIVVLLFAHVLFSFLPVQAEQSQNRLVLFEKIKRFFFGTRPGGTPTGRQRGGAVRGPCSNLDKDIIALVPSTAEGIPFTEQTISERPTFWFYVPYSGLNAEFTLINSQGKDVYSTIFVLNQQPGIINLKLPETVRLLQQGNEYRWNFSAICNPQNRANDAVLKGTLKLIPVSPTLNNQLKTASAKNHVSVYTEANLWYETLTTLAELRYNEPQNTQIKAEWDNVLRLLIHPPSNVPVPQTWVTYSLPNSNENSRSN
ncbi:DUF928 domain-containing protein [Aetokthonos hydrillicola Thurmond2011]|jgi:hypothetical protein|uniref:DUF928 domain-containing protein n=1 Tax=Aetokthonos hydrillicola Thurmond2011 TaxID=2712845 RepID=A0AAP5M9I9_9CYAN|nr:DUF928 domain-containing protein [Aetokthonos hydrillicola]MBO3460783.1 DUF928 domain-containing protein [Aetokthonos hydrillicola CCALA 1050]MBW4585380.1 DUF928 domain-containing protein [Aetokthonos hydrillicola CCALA 1050]MDR9897275.1 DUF928 domain-containing protein [Aetokthonos hydrillicola Thurmond2011]